ncbi:MAG: hypothetical protein HRU15_18205, partial [Planctomycetes bacterium]|nr:hypothetical protein [Planctomycetota bacterium]
TTKDGSWDDGAKHNPCILKHGDTYFLFYTGIKYIEDIPLGDDFNLDRYANTWNTKRIGLATAKSPLGPWEKLPEPIMQPSTDGWDQSIISNAAPCILDDGSIYIIYKSNLLSESVRGPFRLGVAKTIHWSKPFEKIGDGPVISGNVEDPFMWFEDGKFRAIMKDMSGDICGEPHAGIYMWSDNAINWQHNKNCKAYSRNVSWDDGKTRKMNSRERPHVYIENGKPRCLINATAYGGEASKGFSACDDTWCMIAEISRAK